jgi:drug/metabolite transporter (DMT)-like permease
VIPFIVALCLLAAGMHATWNVLLKGSPDPLPSATRAVVSSAALLAPLVLVAWLLAGRPGLPSSAWLVVIASAAAELVYFVFLSRAYQAGELSVVYPIARGTGPVVAVTGGLLILGEHLSTLELVGVFVLLAGIWAVRRPSAGDAVGLAVITGIAIGTYTVLDRVGVRLGPVWLFAWVLWATMGLFLTAWTRAKPLGDLVQPAGRQSMVIGLLMVGAYSCVLVALSVAPVSVVAPLRESAIVLVSAWGILKMKETGSIALRISGAVAIVTGIALIALA